MSAPFSDIIFTHGNKWFLEAPAVHPTRLATPIEMGCLALLDASSKSSRADSHDFDLGSKMHWVAKPESFQTPVEVEEEPGR